ncbi:MAG: pentapeptide repeat-containing protein [Oscillatoriales cyanobacterium SM2_1_8]|nr:pentapeptide repeat-containing protein [Oscillatoriales cyanobacterium SM2_1_8]
MGANLRGTNLQKANLRGARLRGAQIELNKNKKATRLDSEDLLLWSLSNTNRPGRAVTRQNLDGFNLAGATLSRVNFSGSRLTWVDFSDANLAGANFSNATLTGANLQGANLRGARFAGATWDNRRNFCAPYQQGDDLSKRAAGPLHLALKPNQAWSWASPHPNPCSPSAGFDPSGAEERERAKAPPWNQRAEGRSG